MTGLPLAAYVHIPFCTVKCGYCDFNAYAGMDDLKDAYGRALVAEVHASRSVLHGREVTSIGFGGGTPGEVPSADIAAVIEAVRTEATLADDIEISLEANPGTTGAAALAELRRAGVSRISFGAQSFNAAELRFLDRIHSPEANTSAVALARSAGIPSIGCDLIYGIPGQTTDTWLTSLRTAAASGVDHVSTYALTVEEGTPLARRVNRGEVIVPDGDALADLYDLATEELASAGFEQYELSNWARPGHQSRHNRVYWTDREYLGIGAGAHGYLAGERYENIAHPRDYIAAVTGADGARRARASAYIPDETMRMSDWLSLRLRLIEGFEPGEFAAAFGVPPRDVAGEVLEECAAAGVLELAPRIRLTRRGRLLHGEVSARLLALLRTRNLQLGTRP